MVSLGVVRFQTPSSLTPPFSPPIYLVGDCCQLQALFLVQGLLPGENVLVKVILKLLVCHVDAELLEAVMLKVFEPENVENANLGEGCQTEKSSCQLPVCCMTL